MFCFVAENSDGLDDRGNGGILLDVGGALKIEEVCSILMSGIGDSVILNADSMMLSNSTNNR